MNNYEMEKDWIYFQSFSASAKQFEEKELILELLQPSLLKTEQMTLKTGNVIIKSSKFDPLQQFPHDAHTSNKRPNKGT